MLIKIINILTSVALFITIFKAYLVVNKMWRRKAIEEVAESISVTAKLMSFFILSVYFARAVFVEGDWIIAIDLSVGLLMALFMMMVGVKFWVPGRRKALWASIKRAVRSEEKELDNLLRGDKPPKEAELITRILYRIASLDHNVAEEEDALLRSVADSWDLDLEKIKSEEKAKGDVPLSALPEMVESYLSSQPDIPQARQALDLAQRLIMADKNLSGEEELALSELVAMMQAYIDESADGFHKYAACLVPQSETQKESIAKELGLEAEAQVAGGRAFIVGHYYSNNFAEAVCDQYRQKNIMAVVVDERLKAAT